MMNTLIAMPSWAQVASSCMFICTDPSPPLLQARRVGGQRAVLGRQPRQDVLRVADDRDVRRNVLGDLGGIDVDVDELGAGRELCELAGDAVVEPGADGDDEVGLV